MPANEATNPAVPRMAVSTYRRRAPRRNVMTSFACSSLVKWVEARCGGLATAMKHQTEGFDRQTHGRAPNVGGVPDRVKQRSTPTGQPWRAMWQAWCMSRFRELDARGFTRVSKRPGA